MSEFQWFEIDGRKIFRAKMRPLGIRSDLPCPMLIKDGMDPVKSMADGKIYDSKSALRAGYKAGGFVEMGNERPAPKKRTSDRKGIRESLLKAKAQVGI